MSLEPPSRPSWPPRATASRCTSRSCARAALHTAEAPTVDVALPDAPAVPEVLYEPLVARLQGAGHGLALAATVATIGREADRGAAAAGCRSLDAR